MNKKPKTFVAVGADTLDGETVTAPKDRFFRNAWKFSGKVVEVDMPAAREICRDQLREDRKPLLEELDADFMKALESDSSTTEIALEKQRLRDITSDPRISSAKTPEDLSLISI